VGRIYITKKDKVKISEGRLSGNQITFMANNDKYTGIVNGNTIEGTVISGQNNSKWSATRTGN